jgi:hypothetical protein
VSVSVAVCTRGWVWQQFALPEDSQEEQSRKHLSTDLSPQATRQAGHSLQSETLMEPFPRFCAVWFLAGVAAWLNIDDPLPVVAVADPFRAASLHHIS